ncbi:hypothetical protein [Pseudomonas sp. 25 E 4]|nr:hypothetical protein [Pseudomonas sp. 25 E 4]
MIKYQASLVVISTDTADKKAFLTGRFHCFIFLKAKKKGTPKQCPVVTYDQRPRIMPRTIEAALEVA